MTDKLRVERLGRLLEMMEDWPADARPDRRESPEGEERMSTILAMGLGCGWLEQATQHKPCAECGEPRPDWSFYRITAAGQAALDVAKALRAEITSRAFLGTISASQLSEFLRRENIEMDGVTSREQAERLAKHERDISLGIKQPYSKPELYQIPLGQEIIDLVGAARVYLYEASDYHTGKSHEGDALNLALEKVAVLVPWDDEPEDDQPINGMTILEGNDLEEYLADRIGDVENDYTHTHERNIAKMIASCFADHGWEVRRKRDQA